MAREQIVFIGKKFDYPVVVDDHYVGGYLRAKKPRKGETWLRGNDLHDGPNTASTWIELIKDILDCETGRNYTQQIPSLRSRQRKK